LPHERRRHRRQARADEQKARASRSEVLVVRAQLRRAFAAEQSTEVPHEDDDRSVFAPFVPQRGRSPTHILQRGIEQIVVGTYHAWIVPQPRPSLNLGDAAAMSHRRTPCSSCWPPPPASRPNVPPTPKRSPRPDDAARGDEWLIRTSRRVRENLVSFFVGFLPRDERRSAPGRRRAAGVAAAGLVAAVKLQHLTRS
jgi:hypothetical protein